MLDKKNSFEISDNNLKEEKAVELELSVEDKVEELKQQAKERIGEIEANFQELLRDCRQIRFRSEISEFRDKIAEQVLRFICKLSQKTLKRF